MEWWEYAAFVVVGLVMLPVVFGGGFVIAAGIALVVLIVFYGIPWVFGYVEARQTGVSAAKVAGGTEDTPADSTESRWSRK